MGAIDIFSIQPQAINKTLSGTTMLIAAPPKIWAFKE